MTRLLEPDEPGPVLAIEGAPGVPFLLTADHAGRLIPRSLANLGVEEKERERHIAWDIGAHGLAVELSRLLGAACFLQRYSRLVIDCNRPKDVPSSIVTKSEDTLVPGNLGISPEARLARQSEIFDPYHAAIEEEVVRREARGERVVIVTVHSFTPVYRADVRKMHTGILYHPRDPRFGKVILELLREEADLVVGDNEPYAVADDSDYGVLVYGERRGHLNVELEVRQDLIESEAGQTAWAERLARVLRKGLSAF